MTDMSFDLTKTLESKRQFRQRLAVRPIEEKLAMLDAMREPALAINNGRSEAATSELHERPAPYQARKNESQ